MVFTIISHVPHGFASNYYAYAPYVREMNIWTKFVDEVIIVAPLELTEKSAIENDYTHQKIILYSVKQMNLLGLKASLVAFANIPKTLVTIFSAMQKADHIHIRCPGNIGLLGCLVQIFFPSKSKTAKYAGNWDPKAMQPLSYKVQKWILNNTFLTKNMQVLVYGRWTGLSRNIRPFFTASYNDRDAIDVAPKILRDTISFLFVGTLSKGKRASYAIDLVSELAARRRSVTLHLFGDGSERHHLRHYCDEKQMNDIVIFHGNQSEEHVRNAYQKSHFLILPSQSEGWPKAVAEAMFWGCVPIASPVSCVPFMLDQGNRGLLLTMNLESDLEQIERIMDDQDLFDDKVSQSIKWSRYYTLDLFENEIKKLLVGK